MSIIKHIPNLITSAGLLSGCMALVFAARGDLLFVPYWVLLAGFFDFVDGFAARALKVSSPMGKELDSLSDMVSFGLVPAFTMLKLLQTGYQDSLIPYTAFLIAVASAWRLAYFNIDTEQSDKFIGIPTPANAIFITGLVFIPDKWFVGYKFEVLIAMTLVFSWLLNAKLELIALKFKGFQWKGNEPKYLVMLFTLVPLIMLGLKSLSLIIVAYVIISLISNFMVSKSVNHLDV